MAGGEKSCVAHGDDIISPIPRFYLPLTSGCPLQAGPRSLRHYTNQSNTPLILDPGGWWNPSVPSSQGLRVRFGVEFLFGSDCHVVSAPSVVWKSGLGFHVKERTFCIPGPRGTRGGEGNGLHEAGEGREREEARPELEVDRKHRPSQKSIVGSAPQRAPSAGVKSPGRVLGCVWETHKTFTSRARRRTRIDKTRAGRVCRVPYESSSLRVKLGSS